MLHRYSQLYKWYMLLSPAAKHPSSAACCCVLCDLQCPYIDRYDSVVQPVTPTSSLSLVDDLDRISFNPLLFCFFFFFSHNELLRFCFMQIVSVAQARLGQLSEHRLIPANYMSRVYCHLWMLLYSHSSVSTVASSKVHKLWVQSEC